ncbi:MAG TPA: DUF2231 domain-containing protein [Falsiroseomonas sp.]|jgi:uncharacterized membrane protein|nr:DUF2231 domain-containing protein [Falsiroseomonas sp.]
MALRIQEIHPSIVHFPIALLPTALAFDAVGRLTENPRLMDTGRHLIPVAAASAALAGVAGLVAQSAVRMRNNTAHDHLVTHRTLNIALTALLACLAASRGRQSRPGPGYLLAGAAGVAALAYSTYLGGKMVYEHGLGVRSAGGLDEEAAPEIRRGSLGEAARTSARHAAHALRHAAEHATEGELVPTLRRRPKS